MLVLQPQFKMDRDLLGRNVERDAVVFELAVLDRPAFASARSRRARNLGAALLQVELGDLALRVGIALDRSGPLAGNIGGHQGDSKD